MTWPSRSSTSPSTRRRGSCRDMGRPFFGRNTRSSTTQVSGPDRRTTPMADGPGAVAMAAMVSDMEMHSFLYT